MPNEPFSKPVEDTVPRDGDVAVGEDLAFQRRWWVFERAIWSVFALVLMADLLGAFGRGWLAKAQRSDDARTFTVDYERVERASTPSILTLHLAASAVHEGQVNVFVSEDLIRSLGAQRISPEPLRSSLAAGGIDYTFPVKGAPATIEFELEPSFPGLHRFRVALDDASPVEGRVLVLP